MGVTATLCPLRDEQLQTLLSDPDAWDEAFEEDEFDIDKAWDGIHFLLTGGDSDADGPEAFIYEGGTLLEEGSSQRAFMSTEVAVLAEVLGGISSGQLRERFDPAAMMAGQVYPTIWDRDPSEDDTLGSLVEHYEALRDFVAQAARTGLGFVLRIE